MNDERWLNLIDAFGSAAFDEGGWTNALAELAALTGSRAGQLVGFGTQGAAAFNWLVDPDPTWQDELVPVGGIDPAVNPRLNAGMRTPPLVSLTDRDVISAEERRRNPFYRDFLDRHDVPYLCAASLVKEQGTFIGLAVLRSHRQGEIDERQRAVFESIAPHVRMAARTQMLLENRGSDLLAGAMESLSLAAFICDRTGAVKAMTPSAEALLSAGQCLRLRNGELQSLLPAETIALAEAIGAAAGGLARPGRPLAGTVPIRDGSGHPLVLDVLPLPRREYLFGFAPRVLIVARGAQPSSARTLQLLQSLYQLTAAEADVALRLTDGQAVEAIAAARGVSIGTVRSQAKAIYAKLGVHRQGELVARIHLLR